MKNGVYVGNEKYPNFPSDVAKFKTAPTSITRVEFGLSSAGSGTFNTVKDLYQKEGFGPNSTLYKNFAALKAAIPGIDAFNNDDESTYHVPSAVAFTKMLARLGFKNAIVPYTNSRFWRDLVTQVNAQYPGNIDRNYLQVYAGGSSNNPCSSSWNFGIPVYPGLWGGPGRSSVQQVENRMNAWQRQCGITGGFMWLYEDFDKGPLVAAYANAINRALGDEPNDTNLASTSQVTVSSEYHDSNWSKEKLIDGIFGQNGHGEWASNGELKPWAQLTWASEVSAKSVVLYDRPNHIENIHEGTLYFSDSSQIKVAALPNNGTAHTVSFDPKNITWVRFQVDSGNGPNEGLAEIKVIAN